MPSPSLRPTGLPALFGSLLSSSPLVLVTLMLLAPLTPGCTSPAAAQDARPRFEALLSNGERIEGKALTNWHAINSQPQLDGKPLLDAKNPFRWLRDRRHHPRRGDQPRVEMTNGDQLPGVVARFESDSPSSYEAVGGRFLVTPASDFESPTTAADQYVRVLERFVRRIVWQPMAADYRAGQAYLRDGRRIAFRRAKFSTAAVQLLTEDGLKRVGFHELAEIHLRNDQPWERYFDELAVLCPEGEERLLQVETSGGLAVTCSLARFAAYHQGQPQQFARWVHGLHPAWSTQALWISNRDIWIRRSFAPHEAPLFRAPHGHFVSRSPLSGSPHPTMLNRNSQGGSLRSGGKEFGWGVGVHAFSELHLPLHASVRGFRSLVGIDQIVGPGGCVRARVHVDGADGEALFTGPILVGSSREPLPVSIRLPTDKRRQLALVIDPVVKQRPQGADPLDIRDVADWLDPFLELDEAQVRREIQRRTEQNEPAWRDFLVHSRQALIWKTFWDSADVSPGRFDLGVITQQDPVRLSRDITIQPDDRWLMLAVSRPDNKGEDPRIEVRLDGEVVQRVVAPLRDSSHRQLTPQLISLAGYHGPEPRQACLEIIQLPTKEELPVRWSSIRKLSQLPTVANLLPPAESFTAAAGAAPASHLKTDRQDESDGVHFEREARYETSITNTLAIREKPNWGEFRYLRFAFRKLGGGRVGVELLHERTNDQPARYDGGKGPPLSPGAVRVIGGKLNEQWTVVTRDLFADFGNMELNGVTITAAGGGGLDIREIRVARTKQDLAYADAPTVAQPTDPDKQAALVRAATDKAKPATVRVHFADGRVTLGAIVKPTGEILTAGHAVLRPGQPVTVTLSDGREITGTTAGVARNLDVGLVKLKGKEPWPYMSINSAKLVAHQVYAAVTHGEQLQTSKIEPRRIGEEFYWSDLEQPHVRGGLLLDPAANLIGLGIHQSRFGGLVFAKAERFSNLLSRLEKGEVWGSWPARSTPQLGIHVGTSSDGCPIRRIMPDSPAAQAGVREADILVSLDGEAMQSASDLYAMLGNKNPGDTVVVNYRRGTEQLKASIKLAARE